MNRRVLIIGAALLILLGVVLATRNASYPALAARNSAEPNSAEQVTRAAHEMAEPVATRPEPAPSAPASATTPLRSAAPSRAPGQANALQDVDPHVAFGSKNAPVSMEVFSDFQCPACKTLYMTTNRPLMDNYVSTGKVYLVHRDFPLPMHAHSRVAAQYSRAAAQIGKFEPVEQALFQNQEKWEQSGDVDGTVAAVLSPAEMGKVRAIVKSSVPEAAIQKDIALGHTYNVNQTPTTVFHAKGQTFPYSGGMSYDIMKGFLDQLAAQ